MGLSPGAALRRGRDDSEISAHRRELLAIVAGYVRLFVEVGAREGVTMRASRVRLSLGIVLLAVGLSGHLLAAASTGGRYIHYRDHIFGFVFLSAVAWAILALLARRFWPGRRDITVLALGAVQAILGLMIYSRLV